MNCDTSKTKEELFDDMVARFEKRYSTIQEKVVENMNKSLANSKKYVKVLTNDESIDPVQQEKNVSKFLQKCNLKLVQTARLVEELSAYTNHSSIFGTKKFNIAPKKVNSSDQSLLDMSMNSNMERLSELHIDDSKSKKTITESGDHNEVVRLDAKGLTIFDDSVPLKEFNAENGVKNLIYTSVVSMVKSKNGNLVDVLVCNSPKQTPYSFYVQMCKLHDEFVKFQKKLQESYAWYDPHGFPMLPHVGCICIAFCESDKTYYRCRVTSDLSDGWLMIQFVDYGKDKIVHRKNLKRIKPNFLNFPFQAVLCSLENVKSPTLEKKWTLREKNRFNEIVCNQKFCADFKSNHFCYNKPVQVNLHFLFKNKRKIDLEEVLIEEGVAIKKDSLQSKERKQACESISSDKVTQKQTNQPITLHDSEYFDSSNYQEETLSAKVTNQHIVIRMLVPRYSKKFMLGPNSSVVQGILHSSKVKHIRFISPNVLGILRMQKECILKVDGELDHCGKAVFSLLKILMSYFEQNTLSWKQHMGNVESKLGRSVDVKEFVLKFVVAEHFVETVKSCMNKTQTATGTFIFISKADSEQLKICEVDQNDSVLTVVGTVSCCTKALMRIVHKICTCSKFP